MTVEKLLREHEHEIKLISKNLFEYDCLTGEDIVKILSGKKLKKEKVRVVDL